MSSIMLESVSKAFPRRGGGLEALRRVQLAVAEGELLTLVGPSGCGKSTLLRVVAGLEAPDAGRVAIGGRDMTQVAAHERGVAMVFQSHALFPHLSGAGNIAFGVRGGGLRRREIEARVREVSGVLGLERVLDRRPGQMSGGERQRVALARALARRPRVLLLDEPLASLDPQLRVSARDEIRAVHDRFGITTIHVTHDQEEALTLGDRVAVMIAGSIDQVGTPEAVFAAPASVAVARVVGPAGMNLIPGAIMAEGGGLVWMERGGAGRIEVGWMTPEWAGREVMMGARPHSLRPGRGAGGAVCLRLTPTRVEFAGEQISIRAVTSGGESVVVRAEVEARGLVRVGESSEWSVAESDVCWFAPGATGENLRAARVESGGTVGC